MTPGLAFFYGGMVRSNSVLNMLMTNFICLAVIGVLWALYGYSWSFGNDAFGGMVGGNEFAGLGKTIRGFVGVYRPRNGRRGRTVSPPSLRPPEPLRPRSQLSAATANRRSTTRSWIS
jgi:hypothetical protein